MEINNSEFEELQDFLQENCPTVLSLKNQMTEKQFSKLRDTYSLEDLEEILTDMENYKPLAKKYTSVSLTASKWLRRKQDARQTKGISTDNFKRFRKPAQGEYDMQEYYNELRKEYPNLSEEELSRIS